MAQQPLPELSLEELMRIDAGRVFGASERIQPVTEAPASVSFITAEEIARYGYRTLADILRGVRGMYVTDDRNFSLLGTRGFAKPGDYNSRILLLVNGHRVNDNVFGQAEIGAEFGIDPAMFERVEIIRGPASSLYGDSAFFAVVNVITRSGASLDGAAVALEAGTLGTLLTRVSARPALRQRRRRRGFGHLRAERRRPAALFPRVRHAGDQQRHRRRARRRAPGSVLRATALQELSPSPAPTDDGSAMCRPPRSARCSTSSSRREQTTDRHTLADVEYGRSFGASHVTFRGSFDQFSYDGIYPFAGSETDGPVLVARNSVLGTRWTVGTHG